MRVREVAGIFTLLAAGTVTCVLGVCGSRTEYGAPTVATFQVTRNEGALFASLALNELGARRYACFNLVEPRSAGRVHRISNVAGLKRRELQQISQNWRSDQKVLITLLYLDR